MYNPSKDLILSLLSLSGGNSMMSQKRSYSPFSGGGPGEPTTRGLGHNPGTGNTGTGTGNNQFLAGGEHKPNELSQSFIKKIYYRTDHQHIEHSMHTANYQTKYFGISFGIELPISRSNTYVNRGFEPGNAFLFLTVLRN